MKNYNTAIVGATGLVGGEMLKILLQRDFHFNGLRLFATSRSAGRKIPVRDKEIVVEDIEKSVFNGVEVALFAGGEIASEKYACKFVEAGAVVVDNSNTFRMDPEVPLVVPEVNPGDLKRHRGIISNPNCSTIQMVVALKPIYDEAGIERVVVATYQAVSGTGKAAVREVKNQTRDVLDGKDINTEVYPHQIGFNLLPHIGSFTENGYSTEELKMVYETRKIMGDDSLRVTATTVRVPVLIGHAESVNIETKKKITADRVREILKDAPGVTVCDDPFNNIYPYPVMSAHKDNVYVGRIREDISIDRGIEMFIVADNLRKGAALNAVQVMEEMIKMRII